MIPGTFPSYRMVLKSALMTGLWGGGFVALADLSLLDLGYPPHSLFALSVSFLKVIIIYAFVGSLGMSAIGILIYTLARFAGIKLNHHLLFAMDGGAFVYLTVFIVMSQIMTIYAAPSASSVIWVTLISGGCAWVATETIRSVLQKRTSSQVWGGLGALLIGLWLACSVRAWRSIKAMPQIPVPKVVSAPGSDRPNILWIIMDTVRADHLSCYGYKRPTTPFIDRLSREGTLYLNAFSAAPWTYPSHASMLSGLMPSTPSHGGRGTMEWTWLDSQIETLPEILRVQGYETTAISENDFYFSPRVHLDKGFNQFEVVPPPYWPFGSVFDALLLPNMIREMSAILPPALSLRFGQLDPLFVDAVDLPETGIQAQRSNALAMDWINRFSSTQKAPFFLVMNYVEAHSPYGDTPYAGRFLKELPMSLSEAKTRARGDAIHLRDCFLRRKKISHEDQDAYRALYDGDLAYLDESIGRLTDFLRQKGILDNTVLIVTSDHGEYLGEKNYFSHGWDLSNLLLHVPLIIRYPSRFEAGRRIETPVSLTDLFPTLWNLAHVPGRPDSKLAGRNLLSGEMTSRPIFSEVSLHTPWDTYASMRTMLQNTPGASEDAFLVGSKKSVYADGYHFIVTRKGERLYDAKTDPEELIDLWKVRPEIVVRMRRMLQEKINQQIPAWSPLPNGAKN